MAYTWRLYTSNEDKCEIVRLTMNISIRFRTGVVPNYGIGDHGINNDEHDLYQYGPNPPSPGRWLHIIGDSVMTSDTTTGIIAVVLKEELFLISRHLEDDLMCALNVFCTDTER